MAAAKDNPDVPPHEAAFITILNNFGKQSSSQSLPVRTKGFVVLARGATSLKDLQAVCINQTYNHCLTARYRLQPEAGLGTLLVAFLRDLDLFPEGAKSFQGDWRASTTKALDKWKPLRDFYVTRASELGVEILGPSAIPSGIMNEEMLTQLLGSFEDETSVLRTGERLVLFGEFTEEVKDPDEWIIATSQLFEKLPERVGIVLSGAPKDFHLPADNPHYLELEVPPSGETSADPAQTVAKYSLSSLQSDQPAQSDKLGVGPYAEAIARFVLHPQTKAPLTFGIYGEWGKENLHS